MTTPSTWKDQLRTLKPCYAAAQLVAYPDDPQEAWQQHPHGNDLAWLLAKLVADQSSEHRRLIGVLCGTVRRVIPLVPENEERPLRALELAERWVMGDGTATKEMLVHATYAAYDAAGAGYDAASYAAAYAAAYAAYAAYASYTATYAADAASYAAAAADAAALARIADEIRAEFTFDEVWVMWKRRRFGYSS